MPKLFVFESLDAKQMFAASPVNVIGPSSGLHAAAVTRQFDKLTVTSTAQGNDNGSTLGDLDTPIKVTIKTGPGLGSINTQNLVRNAVRLTDLTTGKVYKSSDPNSELQRVKSSGGGDIIVVQTNDLLPKNHQFRLEINGSFSNASNRIRDVDGNAFAAFSATFTTGTYSPPVDSSIKFAQYPQAAGGTKNFVATTIGPDHKLYASTVDGYIYRYTIANDGTLGGEQQISTIRDNNGGPRIITGITFDPNATAGSLVMWVSHNQYRIGDYPDGSRGDFYKYADNFTGKISVIDGVNLQNYQDRVVGIPRSAKDHMVNQLVFSGNGRVLYFGVAALNAMGAADSTWGNRVENIYSASIMQMRLGSGPTGFNTYFKAHNREPINLTIDGDQNTATGLVPNTTHYNIYKGTNPLRLLATGIRNAFDLVVARNGKLYANINGSSAGGNVPATPAFSQVPVQNRVDKQYDKNGNVVPYTGPTSQGLTSVPQTEPDSLVQVVEGKYYGHPNPARGEYIFNGGNPTAGFDNDPFEVSAYPAGQKPDRNYTLPVYKYGTNYSPDGIIQYTSVGGKNKNLDGFLLGTRYSGGSDILALKTNPDGTIDESQTKQRLAGLTGLGSPLDVVEDLTNGNLYVVSLEINLSGGSLMLLKPTA